MSPKRFILVVTSILVSGPPLARAGCVAPISEATAFDGSKAVGRFQVTKAEPFVAQDQTIQTRVKLKVLERFKGEIPAEVEILTPGGTVGRKSDVSSDSISLIPGESYVLLLNETAKGAWSAHPFHAFRARDNQPEVTKFFRGRARGSRPKLVAAPATTIGTDQGAANVPGSVVGYFSTPASDPTRFISGDLDEAVPYLIDIDPSKLPTGMTQSSAIAAVAEALAAWSASSSLKFRFEGLQNFGMASRSVPTLDRKLRIQLHDTYNAINSIGTLGTGGGSYLIPAVAIPPVFTGGRVGSQGFQERTNGWVVMENADNAPFLDTLANYKRVLTHEIGHALGLAHSSDDGLEPELTLKNATMYYLAAPNSGGATLQAYDIETIRRGYALNTPPASIDRTFTAITTTSTSNYSKLPQNTLGVNRIQLRAFDRQGTTVTASLLSSTVLNGAFTLTGTILSYLPIANLLDAKLTDTEIAAGSFRDRADVQFSDGVNPPIVIRCRVVGFAKDTVLADGLPDAWMKANFGTTAVGALTGVTSVRHPDSDPDGDGLTNRMEFMLGTNPNLASSGMPKPTISAAGQLSFTPVRFAPYVIESSPTLAPNSWKIRGFRTSVSGAAISANFMSNTSPAGEFYRVSLIQLAP